jgi:hypothetical protein
MEDDDMRSIFLVCTAFIAACGAGTSPEQPARSQNALTAPSLEIGRPHVLPIGPGNAFATGASTPHLTYYGGKMIPNAKVHVVFWGNAVNATTTARISGFFSSITSSVYFDWLTEYNTPTQSIGRGSLGNTTTITPSNGSAVVTNTDIATELASQIQAGHLAQPDGNALYMVYFPPSVVIQLDAADYSCVQFCAYHNTARAGSTEFYYGVMPDLSVGGCSVGCGGSAQTFDNLTSVSSHELIESITDAEVGFATTVAAPLAWYDANNGEIGDICNAQQARVTGSDGQSWTVQKQWSNQANACITNR